MSKATRQADRIAAESTFASGVRTHLAKATLTISKTAVKATDIATQVDAHIALVQASDVAHTRWLQAVAAERAASTGVTQLMRSVKAYALATFGEDSAEYSDFGFAPRKKRAQTPASKVLQGEHLRATRAARHTMGKKQRLAVTGSTTSSSSGTSNSTSNNNPTPMFNKSA